nr:GTP-binding protein [uncultured Methanobacterium sp.]
MEQISKDSLKIVVFGALNAGKTTFVERLSGQELFLKGEFESITTSFDFVQIEQHGILIHLFASPGHRRFSFMWETLATGMDGAILLIDSTVGITPVDYELVKFIESYNVPYVVAANKEDISKLSTDFIRKQLKLPEEITIWNTSALNDDNLSSFMDNLIQDIIKSENK